MWLLCIDTMMQDLAWFKVQITLIREAIIISIDTKFGNNPGQLKPLDNTTVNDLREELKARGISIQGKLKPVL